MCGSILRKRLVILGSGILGSELAHQTTWDSLSRKINAFDLTDTSSFSMLLDTCEGVMQKAKYDVVINCIANTDTYSKDKQSHWDVNYKGVADLVDFCNKWGIKLVHISSDYVYTNSIENAGENDIPIHGNNWYSYTKLLADSYIQLKSNNYLICRGTHKPTPFPYNKAWTDQIGNFDYVDTISNIIIQLIKNNSSGIFNVGTKTKSIFDLASKTSKVEPAQHPTETPDNTTMNLNKLNNEIKGIIK